jgi:hypothetical protein
MFFEDICLICRKLVENWHVRNFFKIIKENTFITSKMCIITRMLSFLARNSYIDIIFMIVSIFMFLKYANPVYVYCEKCDTDAGNVKRKSDVSGVEAAVRVGRNIKDSCVVNLEDHPSFVVKELNNLLTLSRHETCILNDNDNCEIDQTDGVEEKRESSHNRDPKGMLSEKDKPSSRGETDMNAKEVIVTSKLSDGPGIVEPTKSGKEKRKKRKAEDSEHVKGSEHEISSAEPHKAVNGDHSTDDTKKEERTFSQTKGMEVSKIKTLSTSLLASGGETGDVNGDEVESLQQISKTQANAETMDEKMSKKSKKKQDAAAKNLLDLQTKDQDVGHKDPTPSKIKTFSSFS